MDIATTLGLFAAIGFMVLGVSLGGGAAQTFYDPPSIAITLGGSLAVTSMMYPLRTLLKIPRQCLRVFWSSPPDLRRLIAQLLTLAEAARRDGLLSLERRVEELEEPFLVLGVQLTVDGAQPELLESLLRTEVHSYSESFRDCKAFFDNWGKMAPAFGMIGTLLGLIIMLGNLSDPDALGPGMAVAMITTLYGSVIANVICIPFSEKLASVMKQEVLAREIMVRGILGIQAGESPRLLEQKLNPLLSAKSKAA
jgi:chemotaxis protein MotA